MPKYGINLVTKVPYTHYVELVAETPEDAKQLVISAMADGGRADPQLHRIYQDPTIGAIVTDDTTTEIRSVLPLESEFTVEFSWTRSFSAEVTVLAVDEDEAENKVQDAWDEAYDHDQELAREIQQLVDDSDDGDGPEDFDITDICPA